MEVSIDLQSKAYYKIMLHCLKHLTTDCYGFLLGTKNDNKYTVTNAFPLTHDKILQPSFTVAVSMIKNFFPNEKIIGFYENLIVNQTKEEGAISSQSTYVCEMIGKNNKINPILFQIYSKGKENADPKNLEDDIYFKQFILNEEAFSFVDNKKETKDEFQKMQRFCKTNRQLEIIDFDEHLENPMLDWRNTFVDDN